MYMGGLLAPQVGKNDAVLVQGAGSFPILKLPGFKTHFVF